MASVSPNSSESAGESDQSLNFGLLVGGVEVEMKPTPAAGTPIATLEREIWTFVLRVAQNHPAVFRRLARHVVKRRLPKGNRALEVVAMNDDGPDLHPPLR
jgi:hypothetical protein